MRTLISIALIIHGCIHLLGFLKGFNLARIETIKSGISPILGLFWFGAFAAFVIAGIAYLFEGGVWRLFAASGAVISMVATAYAWNDAKFGMMLNLIFLIMAAASFSTHRFQRKVEAEKKEILSQALPATGVVSETAIQELPQPVQKWLRRSGIVGRPPIRSVRMKQKVLMKMNPGEKDWRLAEAEQLTVPDKPAFIWNVRLELNPFIQVVGRDRFVNGQGAMLIKLNSLINAVNAKGDKIDEGSAQRFLGEMVWYPSFAVSPYVTWEAIDGSSASATLTVGDVACSGVFHFNEDGDVVKFSAMRYKDNRPGAGRYEWIVETIEYAAVDGLKIPSKLKATWKLPEGDWTWLNLEVINMQFK